jgi:thioredoxin-dependent peroxiredoxin
LGASFDTPQDNKAFADAQRFGYRLLSDVNRTVGSSYGVTRGPEEQNPGYPRRIAYLIDATGTIRKAYEVSDVAGFAGEVLADLQSLQRP